MGQTSSPILLYTMLSVILPVALIVIILFYSAKFSLTELDDNKTIANEYGYFLTGFVSVRWILLVIGIVLISGLAFLKVVVTNGFTNVICCCFVKQNPWRQNYERLSATRTDIDKNKQTLTNKCSLLR